MRDKEFERCKRLECRYGDGIILQIIQRLQHGDTLKEIAYDLSQTRPISIPQLKRYVDTTIGTFFYPSEKAVRYYYAKSKFNEHITASEIIRELEGIKHRSNVIYHNFSSPKKVSYDSR